MWASKSLLLLGLVLCWETRRPGRLSAGGNLSGPWPYRVVASSARSSESRASRERPRNDVPSDRSSGPQAPMQAALHSTECFVDSSPSLLGELAPLDNGIHLFCRRQAAGTLSWLFRWAAGCATGTAGVCIEPGPGAREDGPSS